MWEGEDLAPSAASGDFEFSLKTKTLDGLPPLKLQLAIQVTYQWWIEGVIHISLTLPSGRKMKPKSNYRTSDGEGQLFVFAVDLFDEPAGSNPEDLTLIIDGHLDGEGSVSAKNMVFFR